MRDELRRQDPARIEVRVATALVPERARAVHVPERAPAVQVPERAAQRGAEVAGQVQVPDQAAKWKVVVAVQVAEEHWGRRSERPAHPLWHLTARMVFPLV